MILALLLPLATVASFVWLGTYRTTGNEGASLRRVLASIAGIATSFAILTEVFRSTSSTAVVSLLFLPFVAALFAAPGFIIGKAAEGLLLHLDKNIRLTLPSLVALLASAGVLGIWLGW